MKMLCLRLLLPLKTGLKSLAKEEKNYWISFVMNTVTVMKFTYLKEKPESRSLWRKFLHSSNSHLTGDSSPLDSLRAEHHRMLWNYWTQEVDLNIWSLDFPQKKKTKTKQKYDWTLLLPREKNPGENWKRLGKSWYTNHQRLRISEQIET